MYFLMSDEVRSLLENAAFIAEKDEIVSSDEKTFRGQRPIFVSHSIGLDEGRIEVPKRG